jgi:hypothetical protein
MFHLGFCDLGRGLFFKGRVPPKTLSGRCPGINSLRRLANFIGARERQKVCARLGRIVRSPISSPVSQNAAALLFDLGTVDIR